MPVVRCEDLTKLECVVVFDGSEEYVTGQLVAHAKSSHGLGFSEADVEALWKPKPEPKKKVVKKAAKPKKRVWRRKK